MITPTISVDTILTKPNHDPEKMKLDEQLFNDYPTPQVKMTVDRIMDSSTKALYKHLISLRENFSNISINITRINGSKIDTFIVLQSTENIRQWIHELNHIFGSDESSAINIKKYIFSGIFNELDKYIVKSKVTTDEYTYITKFINVDVLFFPYFASIDSNKLNEFKKSLTILTGPISATDHFEERCKEAIDYYKNRHNAYLAEKETILTNYTVKPSDEYIALKHSRERISKLMTELTTDLSRINAIKNVYSPAEKEDIKKKFIQLITNLKTSFKKIEKTETYVKEKEENKLTRKIHNFLLEIELTTNIANNQELKYVPQMTVPLSKGPFLYFTPLFQLQPNIVEDNNTDKIYTQFIEKPEFDTLTHSIMSSFNIQVPVEPSEYEYWPVNKKKEDKTTLNNIQTVLKTFFRQSNPFYINGQRYTVVSYEWNNIIVSIKKNGKLDIYEDVETIAPNQFHLNMLIDPIKSLLKRLYEIVDDPPRNIQIVVSSLYEIIKILKKNKSNRTHVYTEDDMDGLKILNDITHATNVIQQMYSNVQDEPKIQLINNEIIDKIIDTLNNTFKFKNTVLILHRMQTLYEELVETDADLDTVMTISKEYFMLKQILCEEDALLGDKALLTEWCLNTNEIIGIVDSVDNANYLLNYMDEKMNLKNTYWMDISNTTDEINTIAKSYRIYKNIAMSTRYAKPSDLEYSKLLKNDKIKKENELARTANLYLSNFLKMIPKYSTNISKLHKTRQEYTKSLFDLFKETTKQTIKKPQTGGYYQRGGTLKYIDVGENILPNSALEQERTNEMKRELEEEMKWMQQTMSIPGENDKPEVMVEWKFLIEVQLYLVPGDKLGLSEFYTIDCMSKKDNIVNLFNKLKTSWSVNPNKTQKKRVRPSVAVYKEKNQTVKKTNVSNPVKNTDVSKQ